MSQFSCFRSFGAALLIGSAISLFNGCSDSSSNFNPNAGGYAKPGEPGYIDHDDIRDAVDGPIPVFDPPRRKRHPGEMY
ncbi:MAG: hypothetical protein KDA84_03260 [Planctomycetaceae bacterium]|nr:hypothetical protein [Planctomycetaceae bacterium]